MSGNLDTRFLAIEMRSRSYQVLEGAVTAITGGAADSRKVLPGDLFCAFPGETADGNAFVAEALDAGAVAALCSRPPEGEWPGATIVIAPDTTRAAGELAHAWRLACNPRVVAITGTVGKTTAKDLTAAALSQHFRTHSSPGNLNSREGMPLALLSLRRDHEVSVLEFGMDRAGEIVELCEIAQPQVGIVLNIGLTHAAKLGDAAAIADEKLSLVRWLPESATAILNMDDHRVAAAHDELRCRVIGFGSNGSGAALTYRDVADFGLDGTEFTVRLLLEEARVRLRVPGAHTIPAALAAIAAGYALGLTVAEAAAAVSASSVDGGRLQVRASDTGAVILDDRYNSSPLSLAGALRLLAGRPPHRIAFLGPMAELGEHEEDEHRRAGKLAAAACDLLVAVGEPGRVLVNAARAEGLADAYWFEDKREAAAFVRERLTTGDTVLLKASRSAALETVIPFLEGEA